MSRPSWLETYISIAFIVAERSPDTQTKCGCVITNSENVVLGTGYNGFAKDIDIEGLPTERPLKYLHMVHSEINAINNCAIKPTIGSIAYITTIPCFNCLISLWSNKVSTIYYSTLYTPKCVKPEDEELRKDFIRRTGNRLALIPVDFQQDLLRKTSEKIMSYRGK